jgi:multiple sugar transport system permease protein
LALGCGLWVTRRAVSLTRVDLLEKETAIAVELYRGAGDTIALGRVFGDRWELSDELSPLLDEAEVHDYAGRLVGAATVYDADSWFEIGTLYLDEGHKPGSSFPQAVVLLSVFALTGLVFLSRTLVNSSGSSKSRRIGLQVLALVLLASPLGVALRWAHVRLDEASLARLNTGAEALGLTPNLDSLVALPGGVTYATGADYVVRATNGSVEFSTLPSAATEHLHSVRIEGTERVTADRVEYLATDVSKVRLAVLPYDQTDSPAATVWTVLIVGLLLAALPLALASQVDQPRVFHRNLVAWSFLAPAALHLAVFTLGPLGAAAWLSLHRWSLLDVARPFVGLANYGRILGDSAFWNAIKNTVIFALHVPVSMSIALALALLIQRRVRGIVLLRAMLFLPTITSLVAVAMVWQWMLHDEYGMFNWILSLAGVDPVRWLSSPSTALLSIMIMATWMVVGYQMILFQAGLGAIPSDLYDAARIDGAGALRRFLHVTLPGLRHTLFFVLVTSVIGSFQVFGAVYVMTEGGPLHATDVAVFHIYQEAWEYLRFGDAAAMSWVLFAIIFLATWIQFRTLERRVEADT